VTHPPFPHQPTTNQWFQDDQFESYRMLGLHTVLTLARDARELSVEALCSSVGARGGSAASPESAVARSPP
jgi:hypothetical protein